MWLLLVVLIVVALVICSQPLPSPPRHRAESMPAPNASPVSLAPAERLDQA